LIVKDLARPYGRAFFMWGHLCGLR